MPNELPGWGEKQPMRSKYVIKNSLWGILSQILSIILGFVGRTVFIRILNAEYLGISGLFSNVLSFLSLSELGFSSAVAFHLYGLIASGDNEKIAGVMNYYKRVYRVIASIILSIGLLLVPFLQYLIKESTFEISYIRLVYVIYLLNTVTSYLFSYRYTLATADQKNYILVQVDSIFKILGCIANIIVLVILKNFIVYLIAQMAVGIVGNYVKAQRVTKKYLVLKEKNEISEEEKKKITSDVKNIFAGKVSTVIVTSTDNILISVMINLTAVGLYSNYAMIIGYIQSFLSQFTTATQASIGNLIASESKEYAYSVLNKLTQIIFFAVSFCATSLFVLLNPFIELWVGNQYLLDMNVVFWCVLSFYIQIIKAPLWYTLGGAGLFKDDRNISIIGAVSNLVISVVCAYIWGFAGIFMGTVFSQLIQWVLKAILLGRKYLFMKCTGYVLLFFESTGMLLVFFAATYYLSSLIVLESELLSFLIKCMLCVIVPNAINFFVFRKSEGMQYMKSLIGRITKTITRR